MNSIQETYSEEMYSVGIDLGGTKIAAALIDRQGNILSYAEVPTKAEEGPTAVMDRMAQIALTVIDDFTSESGWQDRLRGVGIGSPGPLNPKTGIVYGPPNLPGWDSVLLRDEMERRLGVPVTLDNDANAATLAEARLGAGQGVQNLVYITVSTGIGGGVVLDGKVRQGDSGAAAEIGHHSIQFDGPSCTCGNRGCLEVLASGTAISRMAGERLGRTLDAKGVATLALQGDAIAQSLLSDVFRALGAGLVNVVNMFDPAIIIIGGGVAQIGPSMFDALQQAVDANQFRSQLAPRVKVVPAMLGTRAGVIGAALLPWMAK